jgi:predicted nucleic acid-binding protein
MNADFLDTNIFVYLFDETDERRREIARRLVHGGIESGDAASVFRSFRKPSPCLPAN